VNLSLRLRFTRTSLCLLALTLAHFDLLAQGSDKEAITRGQSQFRKSCSFCHGPDATGGTEGPNLTMSSLVRHDKNGDLIGTVIREGRPAKGMPPFPLAPAEVSDLVQYIHSRVAELDRRSAGKPPATYALEHLLTGNAEAGKRFFDGKGGCSGCHSASGDLRGIASKYAPVELQTRFLYPQDTQETAQVQYRHLRPSGLVSLLAA
jgi:cytochrome c oxidase cbb3-type subunit III